MSSRKKSNSITADPTEDEDLGKAVDMLDRRRLQNRISQRNYRNKIKRRLEKLESLLGPEAAAESHDTLDKPTARRQSNASRAVDDEDASPDSPSTITVRGSRVLDAPGACDTQATPNQMKSPSRMRPPLPSNSSTSSATTSKTSSSATECIIEESTNDADSTSCVIANETLLELPLMDEVHTNVDGFDWSTLLDNHPSAPVEELLYKAREANMANTGINTIAYNPGYINPYVGQDTNAAGVAQGWPFASAPAGAVAARSTAAADHCSNPTCGGVQGSPAQNYLASQVTGMNPASPPFSRAHALHRYASAPAVPQLGGMVPGQAAGSVPQPMFFLAVPLSSSTMPALDLQGFYASAQQGPGPSTPSLGGGPS